MKSEFKAKLIQHMLNKKNGEQGFTLIELLVVIIIIGILAAIALPSFLNQAAKARQSEAKTYVGSMNRAQQAYFLEKQAFATNLSTLALGIPSTTTNYTYATVGALPTTTGTANNAFSSASVTASSNLKTYAGAVNIATPVGTGEATSLATLCEGLLAPINSGTSTPTLAVAFVLTTTAAPRCLTTATVGFAGIQ